MTWREDVEAAVDNFGGAAADAGLSQAVHGWRGEAMEARAALMDIVTKGRCPECGESTIPDCNVNGRHVDHLCVSCEMDGDATQLEAWDPRKSIAKALEPTGVGWCNCGGILADASTLQRKATKCTRCGRMNWEGGENP